MARYSGPVCRLCRREGMKLFLKGDRCYSDKCAVEKRPTIPGQHGKLKPKQSDYGIRLREKQRLRKIYGINEKQFRNYFFLADKMQGITGHNLFSLLERRLDNVVYRLGFADSRSQARQLVRHAFFQVNGKKVNIPSYIVKKGDIINLASKEDIPVVITQSLEAVVRRGVPEWLELNVEEYKGVIRQNPERLHISYPIQEQFIVEFYSK